MAIGCTVTVTLSYLIFAYASGNAIISDYLFISYIPNAGELAVVCSALLGASLAFLWFNCYPAEVFMGDTGSLSIGAIIAVFAIAIRKELLIPILAGVFLIENLSVIIQVSYFKYSKKRHGQGKRVFLMSPLHHHFQKKGIHESKIATRFWIFGIFLAIFTLITLKLR